MTEKHTAYATKMHVVTMLQSMMEQQPLEKIKVSTLCKRAAISRTTFYEHFHDVFAVPTWLWDELMSQSLYQMGISLSCFEAHVKNFHLLLQYKDFFALAFKSDNYNSVFGHGGRIVKEHLIANASKNAERAFTQREMLEIEFRNAGAAFMTKLWASSGMRESPEEMASLFQSFTPGFLVAYLEVD